MEENDKPRTWQDICKDIHDEIIELGLDAPLVHWDTNEQASEKILAALKYCRAKIAKLEEELSRVERG